MEKSQIIKIVTEAAILYRENLVGKNLLFVFYNKIEKRYEYLETKFLPSNFLHLTGLKLTVVRRNIEDDEYTETDYIPNAIDSAALFYNACISGKLSENDFWISNQHTTSLKLSVIKQLMSINKNARSIGYSNCINSGLQADVFTSDSQGCLGFRNEDYGDYLIPNTVVKNDIRVYVGQSFTILAVFEKRVNDLKYRTVTRKLRTLDISEFIRECMNCRIEVIDYDFIIW